MPYIITRAYNKGPATVRVVSTFTDLHNIHKKWIVIKYKSRYSLQQTVKGQKTGSYYRMGLRRIAETLGYEYKRMKELLK